MKLSVENLSNDASEQEVRRLFSSFGVVRSIDLTLGMLHSEKPGSGIVALEGDHADYVVAALNGRLFRGNTLRVKEVRVTQDSASSPKADAVRTATDAPSRHLQSQFRVASVVRLSHSESGQPDEWCRYTITSGASCIAGLHRGNVAEVTEYAENAAEAFNLRNQVRRGRPPAWSSRKKT
jgi:hypothetical protein